MKRVLVVIGTRPEAIKMAPLILKLKEDKYFDVTVCSTGQHKEMLDQVLNYFRIVPDISLKIMVPNQTLFDINSNLLVKMENVINTAKPDIVLVHGDTSTAFVSALASYYSNVKVGHVEAGLRTYNIYSPYPEEFNRQAISLISCFNFAPTELAKNNLIQERKRESTIYVTGNTVIDAMKYTVRPDYYHNELEWVGNSKLIFITAHRRENLGEPMRNMFKAIRRVLDEHPDVKAIYPIHLNPIVRQIASEIFDGCDRIHIIEPIDVVDCHNFEARCFICLTDSGGIQEECPTFGKPVLVMRNTTERPEGIQAGTLKLVGTSEDNIYKWFSLLLENEEEYKKMSTASNPYGDGRACERIVNILKKNL